MKYLKGAFLASIVCMFGCVNTQTNSTSTEINSEIGYINLETGFLNPPHSAGVRCFWWWLNGNVTKEAITRDLEEMKDKGFSGALIFDANGANQQGNENVPAGPLFASPEWTKLFVHT